MQHRAMSAHRRQSEIDGGLQLQEEVEWSVVQEGIVEADGGN